MLLSLFPPAWARCASTAADLSASLDSAETAYTAMQLQQFVVAMRTTDTIAACLTERPSRAAIARLHRMHGLDAFARAPERARWAFVAARSIEPQYSFPESLVPAGHPVAEAFARATPSGESGSDVSLSTGARLFLDGSEAAERMPDRSALAQIVRDDGVVTASAYLWPDEPLFPELEAVANPSPAADPTATAAPKPGRRRPFFVELAGGYATGDVDRGYSQRVALDSELTVDSEASWNGPGDGRGAVVRLVVAYAPTWYLDVGGALGAQWGRKYMDTGWNCTTCAEGSDTTVYDAVSAIRLLSELRLRGLPVRAGRVHPYLLLAVTAESFDGFEVPEADNIDYDDAPGGVDVGLTGGVGLAVDVSPHIVLSLEVPYTRWLIRNEREQDDSLAGDPVELDSTGGTLRALFGAGIRL